MNDKAAQLALEATDYYAEYDVDGTIKKQLQSRPLENQNMSRMFSSSISGESSF